MKTKCFSLIIAIALISTYAQAQNAASFGIHGGVNFQNINGKDFLGNSLENDLVPRFNAGINVAVPVAPDFYIQPGLGYATKGTKGDYQFLEQTVTREVNLGYLELPVNLVYKPLLGTGNLVLGFGPYAGYAINGKVKIDGENFDVEFVSEVEDAGSDEIFYFKRLDAGANMFVGYELAGGLSLQLNTQLGLIDINSDNRLLSSDKSVSKHTGFGLSLGYRFK
jgi:hypothetical protein